MSNNKEILKWYLESGVDEVIEDTPVNHFEEYKKRKIKKTEMKKEVKTTQTLEEKIEKKKLKEEALQNGIRECKEAEQAIKNVKTLEELKTAIENFKGCQLIKSIAKNTVFSRGNPEGDIMIIGEAPGAEEDAQGIPFCGDSGKLLDNMLKSIGLEDRVYITNTLFWRPPGNRRPTNDELKACSPFFKKHIALFNPKLIIVTGATAMNAVLKENLGITKMRSQFFDYKNEYLEKPIKATPLFHPSFLIRQPTKKCDAWKDWLIIRDFVNENI